MKSGAGASDLASNVHREPTQRDRIEILEHEEPRSYRGRTAVDRTSTPFRSRAKHKNMAVFQASSSRFKCLFNQRKIVPAFFFFISFGTPALTSLLPTDLFA